MRRSQKHLKNIDMKLMRNILSKNTHEFCMNSTLHGLKYIADEKLYAVERVFFALAFVVVLLLSGYFILNVYDKWSTTPVIYSINSEPTFVTTEPFPAVTICNLNQACKDKALRYAENSIEYAKLQLLCDSEVNVSIVDTITDWNNLDKFIQENSQPCSDMLLTCRFGAVDFNCSDFFHPIVTDEGMCCVFNTVHPKFMYSAQFPGEMNFTYGSGYKPVQWNSERGYPTELPNKYVPQPAIGTGETLGLSVTLDVQMENYYCSSSNSVGFKIALHSPTETPKVRETGLLLAPGRETKIRIRTEKVESDPRLRAMDVKLRQCLFQDEAHLLAFSHYSQRNCEMECVASMLIRECGCITHYMPKLHSDICSIYDSSCVEKVRLASMLSHVPYVGCNACLPSCFELTYYPDFFSAPLSHDGFEIKNKIVRNISTKYVEKNIAVVTMFFKDNSYRSNKQSEYIGFTDFLSSVGGLMGLFLGFSFISLAEFFYYAFIRPCRSVHLQEKLRIKKKKNLISALQKSFSHSEPKGCNVRVSLAERRELKMQKLVYSITEQLSEKERSKNFAKIREVW